MRNLLRLKYAAIHVHESVGRNFLPHAWHGYAGPLSLTRLREEFKHALMKSEKSRGTCGKVCSEMNSYGNGKVLTKQFQLDD